MPLDGTNYISAEQSELLDAAAVLRERGWCQHVLQADDGRMCMVGAIASIQLKSTTDLWKVRLSTPTFARILAIAPDIGRFGFAAWNNHPQRTAEQVITLLELAAQ